jgi:hypothetical protein
MQSPKGDMLGRDWALDVNLFGGNPPCPPFGERGGQGIAPILQSGEVFPYLVQREAGGIG